jgi:quercetin dioxygenase-like cupin family protein
MLILNDNTKRYEFDGDVLVRLDFETTLLTGIGTVFGVVLYGSAKVGGREVLAGEFFCRTVPESGLSIESLGRVAVFQRLDWCGQEVIAGVIEPNIGRIKYIDGCTDSLLVAPPKLGEPCLNALYFPPGINQSFHTHPSSRLGAVLSGSGFACLDGEELQLAQGDVFFLPADEVHRFRTENDPMVVVAYHPDSDWGATDEVHPMINRTFLEPTDYTREILRHLYLPS